MEGRVDHAKCSWLLGLRRHRAYDAKASCAHTEELQDADRSLRTHLSLLNRMNWIMAAKSGWNCVNEFTRFLPIPNRAVPFTKLWHRSSKTFKSVLKDAVVLISRFALLIRVNQVVSTFHLSCYVISLQSFFKTLDALFGQAHVLIRRLRKT
jgi:hypothetical protein